jgi:hypothetical protein
MAKVIVTFIRIYKEAEHQIASEYKFLVCVKMGETSSFYFKVFGIHIDTNNFPTHTSLTFTNRRPKFGGNKCNSRALIYIQRSP